MSWREHVARAVVLLVAGGSVAAVSRLRDPDPVPAPALASPATSAPAAADAPAKRPGVALRLVERIASAVIDAPSLDSVNAELAYWRRMRSPYVATDSDAGRAVQQVSLVRSAGRASKQEIGGGAVWVPDPKVWNMNEGSFDQREAILAPPPATLRFPKIALPAGAVFETAPAIAGAALGGVEFEVAVKDESGERKVVGTRFVEGGRMGSFSDWQIPLAAFAGKTVELELVTRARAVGDVHPAAYWGTPVVLGDAVSSLPFNVLFIVVDALRADALSAVHDDATDAAMQKANPPPLDAWLPRMPEVAPRLDALAQRGVLFTRAYSGGTWTRPGTLAMLAGAHSSHLGLSATPLVPQPADVQKLYTSKPPFLPLLFRPEGALTRAIVNNFYMVGYAGVGIDMGFEGLVDHRYGREDTREIVKDTLSLLEQHKSRRFFFFVNFCSPHSPYAPPPSAKAAIPPPPAAPAEKLIRDYLAEIHKDDAAIGELVDQLDKLGLTEQTLVVVTGDHGETLSREHEVVPEGVDGGPQISGRFHHLSSLYDETAHVPLLLVLPKTLPAGRRVVDPVSAVDILPTLAELAHVPIPPRVRGTSLVPLIHGKSDPERTVVVEGRGAHSVRVGHHRLVVREPGYQYVRVKGRRLERKVELYDLSTDPGERVEVSAQHADVVERLLGADARRKETASAVGASAEAPPKWRLRFTGGAASHRMRGRITARSGDGRPAKLSFTPVELPERAVRVAGDALELELETVPEAVHGIDLGVEPAGADLEWTFTLDGAPFPKERFFGGGFGLQVIGLDTGVRGDGLRRQVVGSLAPWIDASGDASVYVLADRSTRSLDAPGSDAAKAEAMGLMKAWGYVR